MNNFKKIISLSLIVCIIFSSLCVYAEYINPYDKDRPSYEYIDSIYKNDMEGFEIADDEDTNTAENSQFKLLEKLGIIDDASHNGAEFITKTEFNIIMSRFKLGAGNALENVYVDNPDNKYAANKDALKFLLEALGYYYRCAEYNFTDESLLIVAQQIGLLKNGVEISNINTNIVRSTLMGLLFNALEIDLCEGPNSAYGFSSAVKKGVNILNSVHNVYKINGYVNAIYGASVFGNGTVREGHMEIDRNDILCGGYKASEFWGKRVVAYGKQDSVSGTYTLVYITEEKDNKSVVIDFKDILDVKDNGIEYTDENGEEQLIDISDVKYISLNGEGTPSITEAFNPSENDGRIILSSSTKNGDIDCAIIWKYSYYVVDYNSIYQNRIGLSFGYEYNGLPYITVDSHNVNDISIDGIDADVEKIKSGMTIRVAQSASKKFTQIYAVTGVVEGETSACSENEIIISGNQYRYSETLRKQILKTKTEPELENLARVNELTAGINADFYVYDDILVAYKEETDYKFAYLKSVILGKGTIDPDVSLRVFTQGGEWLTYPVADKLSLDGTVMTREKALDIIKADTSVINNIIRYRLNRDGGVAELDTILDKSNEMGDSGRTKAVDGNPNSTRIDWTYSFLGLNTEYRFDNSTIVFNVPKDRTKEDSYRVLKTTQLPIDTTYLMDFYSPNDFNIIRVAVWETDDAVFEGDITRYMHVEKISSVRADSEDYEIEYRILGTEYKDLRARGKGECIDASFLISEKLFDASGIKVGSFVGMALSGENITNVKVYSEDGVVSSSDSHTIIASTGNVKQIIVGRVKAVDPINHYILAEYTVSENVNGTQQYVTKNFLTCPRAMGVIDTVRNVTIPATINDFSKDDRLVIFDTVGHGTWMFKNMQ